MTYHLHAALALERQKTLLAEAEAFRRAKQARTQPTAVTRSARSAAQAIRRWLTAGKLGESLAEQPGSRMLKAHRRPDLCHPGDPRPDRSRPSAAAYQ